ncbi:DUF7344 domain-containing protein [Halorussus ruber]|uniref:DUF7344 domain-containing protein n=1 Tax=Halorussus ruber TaxID=1126238 RepID=UPI001092965B|nr:hypothetical protein [Halorussus ruber]
MTSDGPDIDSSDSHSTDADSSDSDSANTDTAAEVDAAFRVLSDVHRRYALYYLRDRETATIAELATILAGWLGTRGDASRVVTTEERERLLVALHHAHLPELTKADLVSYDPETGDVSVESLPEIVEAALDTSLEQQRDAPDRPEERRFGWRTGK